MWGYRSVEVFGHSFSFYYDSKRHRWWISIDYGEHEIDITRKEGDTIYEFLSEMKDLFESRINLRRARAKKFRSRSQSEDAFDIWMTKKL